jgi:steroid delta-isomerase-like uncharacterized protein
MSAHIKNVVHRIMDEVMNTGNLSVLDEIAHPDVIDHTVPPGMPAGREGVKAAIAMYRTAFPDMHSVLEDMIVDGDRVATRYTLTGTHQGEFMGIPATGKRVSVSGIDIMRFRDGKITERWAQEDNLGMLQQLGIVEV